MTEAPELTTEPPAEPAAEEAKQDKSATVYLVLQKDAGEGEWKTLATYSARTAKEATAKAVKDKELTEGTFVAVPARSWKPLTLSVETQPRVKLS